MEVRLFPNSARPGIGLKPKREAQRPLLPQHARHCPVLEAGSAMGFLVFPPLEPYESYYIGYEGDGRYVFMYYLTPPNGSPQQMFTVTLQMPVGSIGAMREDVRFDHKDVPLNREQALLMLRQFIVPEDLGTPPGALALRGVHVRFDGSVELGGDITRTPFDLRTEPPAWQLVCRRFRREALPSPLGQRRCTEAIEGRTMVRHDQAIGGRDGA